MRGGGDAATLLWERAHWALPAVGAVIVACAHHPLLGPVIDQGGDNADHLLNEYALASAAAAGDNPLGPLGLEFGLPLLRFYQGLFYLVGLGVHVASGLDVRLVHNLLVAICFTLSPFALCFCLERLGLRRFAAGFGSLASLASVGAFGNSFEAYHGIGIATQAMGALFFPLFLGAFAGMLQGRNGWAPAALAFAAAFLSHASVAVYSVLAAVLYLLVVPSDLRAGLRRLALFGVLGGALVAFWALPFLSHTAEMRAVPDSVFRGDAKLWWFTSVGEDEMIELAASGRLLDDSRQIAAGPKPRLDALLDKISCIESTGGRPPVMTILAAIGLAIALVRFRRSGHRFLSAGLAFSLILFAGPDDFAWLRHLPFVEHLQTFRSTYLFELFAYGLVGVGVEALLRHALAFVRGRRGTRRAILAVAWTAILAAGVAAACAQIASLGARFVRPHDQRIVDEALDAVGSIPNRGYPFRLYSAERWNVFEDWLASGGLRPVCTHWFGVGPSAGLQLCSAMERHPERIDLFALAGVRWFSGKGERIDGFLKAADRRGRALYVRMENGKDRAGADNSRYVLLDSGRDTAVTLRPASAVVAVVCDDAQWIWLVRSWLSKHGGRAGRADTPMPVRVARGGLASSGLLRAARAIAYAGEADGADARAISEFAAGGGAVFATRPIPGVRTSPAGLGARLWRSLATARGRAADPRAAAVHLDDAGRSNQRFGFEVRAEEPLLAILPTEAVPGWTATLDGRHLDLFPSGPDLVGALVPAGSHVLRFEWRMPAPHLAALVASLVALAIALVLCIRGRPGGSIAVRRDAGVVSVAWLARRHLVAAALVGTLAWSALEVYTVGTPPAPQSPPFGATLYGPSAELRWGRGTRGGEIRLQVAPDDPGFAAPVVDEVVSGAGRKIEGLEAGRTYTWRLVRDGEPGRNMEFEIARDAFGF